jgi:hypothetical protein
MHFILRKDWFCQFLEEDLKTALPKTIRFTDDKKIWEMAKRGGFTLNISGRQKLEEKIRKGTGGGVAGAYAGAMPACRSENLPWPGLAFYNRPFPDFFAAAQRLRIDSAMRLRAAVDMVRRSLATPAGAAVVAAGLLVLPGGRPRRLPWPPISSKA